MADESQTTGTPEQNGGDAASQPTTGTPAPEVRDAGSNEPDYKQLYLANKSTVEEANRIIRTSREPEPQRPAPAGNEDSDAAEYERYRKGLYENQDPGGLWARVDKRRDEQLQQLSQNYQALGGFVGHMLKKLPDEQRAVFEEYAKNPQQYGSIEDAERTIDLRRKDSEIQRLQAENKRLANQNAVPTNGRESVAVPELKKEMTRVEWQKRQASLPMDQRYAEQKKLRNGEIKVDW